MLSRLFSLVCAGLALGAGLVFAQSEAASKGAAGKFYVAELTGSAQVRIGERILELTESAVFDAEGAYLESKADSSYAIVLSNGVGLNFAPATQLRINRFLQDPFPPNRENLDSEPSRTRTRALLTGGTLGICGGQSAPGSSMEYDTPHGSVSLLGQNTLRAVISVSDEATIVSLFAGSATLRGDKMAESESLLAGQQARLRSRGPTQPAEIIIGTLPSEGAEPLEDIANGACQARRKVFFDTTGEEAGPAGPTLFAVPVDPVDPTEVGPAASVARP
jgi:hypothetical protein